MRWGPLFAGALLLAAGCTLTPREGLNFPSESLLVTGRSTRPLPRSESPTPDPISLTPRSAHPIVTTTVIATAEAQVPADVLGPRLASLYAREEARLAALTLALERRGEVAWSDGVNDSNAGALLPQLEANTWIDEVSDQESGLDGTQQLLREPTRVRATVTYPTVAVDSQPEEPGLNAEPAPAIELDRDVQREMEEEAREEATIALRETLSRTEVSPGVTLSRWMEMQSIEPQALDRILRRARTVRMDHEIDRSQSLGICEVELDFDTGSLNRLR